MNPIRIIGIGSPFGGDRIAWEAVDAIAHGGMLDRFPRDIVQTFCTGAPATDLLPMMSGAKAVILIDAVSSGALPGTVHKIDASKLMIEAENLSSHALGVPECLALGSSLGMLPKTVLLYGVEIREDGTDEGATAPMPDLLRAIAGELEALVRLDERARAQHRSRANGNDG
ncbi:hydrogenase maturation protease [Noviherbaspirillum sp.]|uniref:hydrogenase maturation protease n=1 Tax=Noviherbaspirillum sp. TaxID=1926288 RepID=UPI002B480EB0|nr:hydrogenase maturation protease [Noviherbaspirillum sp.]HJV81893.1 hydrogenase maturation protease [Noviherbaspirillum sp.]